MRINLPFSSLWFFLVFLFSIPVYSQVPEAINYQVVVRDELGEVLSNHGVDFHIYIYNGDPNQGGIMVYKEYHLEQTDTFGMVDFSIGLGSVMSPDSLKDIDWGNGAYYLEVRSDVNKDGNYVIMGNVQLLSVPYALYSKASGSGGKPGSTGPAGTNGSNGTNGADGTTGVD
ncbi:MAG TPA: collagen-like protein, partial [Bacteroidetes bacterium]|nr:collagen-like protein [Bacteroidota bacterium]